MGQPESGGPLFDRLASFENLYRAACDARRGKRFKPGVARFHHDLAANLVDLRDELLEGRYRSGPYREFIIYEPARRFISAAPYRDRVVHHALCNIIEPIFEGSFIFHQILLEKLQRRIHDGRVLGLARTILDHSNAQPPAEFYFPGDDLFTPFERRKGLPIGNLTSQFCWMKRASNWSECACC